MTPGVPQEGVQMPVALKFNTGPKARKVAADLDLPH